MGKIKVTKREQLNHLKTMVAAVDQKFKAGNKDHHTAAVLGMFVGETQGGTFSAEDLQDDWEELADIGKVVRDDFCLRPAKTGEWEVIPMIGIDGLNEEEVH